MKTMNSRGSVLVQVLVSTAFMAFIVVSVLRMRLQPAVTAAGNVSRVSDDLAARSALNRLTESWSRLGTCASDSEAGVACAGGGCNCSCTVDTVVVTASPQGGACALKASPASP